MKTAPAAPTGNNDYGGETVTSSKGLEKKLSVFLREFNISRKNSLIYPPGHVQIARGLARIGRLLDRLFDETEKIEIGVTANGLLAFSCTLDSKNGIYKEIAVSLKSFDIATIAFVKGISRAELALLFELLAADPESVRAEGGIQGALSRSEVRHVIIRQVDYGKFQHTDEKVIRKQGVTAVDTAHENLWQHFIVHSMSETLVPGGHGVILDHKRPPSPVELARLLNEGRINAESALEGYMHTIRASFSDDDQRLIDALDSKVYLKSFNALLKELHPNLRRQFLSVTYQQCASVDSTAPVERFLSGLSNIFIIEMLRQANKDGEELSPSLLNLVYKIVHIQDKATGEDPAAVIDDAGAGGVSFNDQTQLSEIRHLFKREDYESYIPDTYSKMLKSLSEEGPPRPVDGDNDGARYLQEILPTLDDAYVDRRIAAALLALLNSQNHCDEYGEFAERLVKMADDLLSSGNFSSLSAVIETLERHQEEKTDKRIREIAAGIRERLQEASFISRAVAAFYQWSDREEQSAAKLILTLGSKIVPEILMLYAKMEIPEKAPILYKILSHFPEHACVEARKRLNDSRPLFVKHLVVLIRRLGCKEGVEEIRELMNHPDPVVRMEGLEALVSFKDPRALFFLRKHLNSSSETAFGPAVRLAGKYKVSGIVDDLIAMLRRFAMSKSDFRKNEMIISALGQIGDTRAIPVLSKLVKTKWGLYPKERRQMNRTLYNSLLGYKRSSVMPLLKYGRAHGSAGIKEICNNLIGNPDLSN